MARLRTVPVKVAPAPSRLPAGPAASVTWRTGKTTAQRGYGGRWQRYRLQYLAQHPLCVMCKAEGRVEAATVVDHVQPHEGDERLFWSPANHQALCKAHHDGAKQREDASRRRGAAGPYAERHQPHGEGVPKARKPRSS